MLRKAIVSFPHRKKSFVHLLNRMIVIDIRTVGRHPEKRSENKVCGDSIFLSEPIVELTKKLSEGAGLMLYFIIHLKYRAI